MELNLGTSVFKREDRPAEQVIRLLSQNGWSRTGSIGDRVTYMENSGINITVIQGAAGTIIIPSGPIRGRIFGDNNRFFSNVSVIGAGRNTGENNRRPQEATNRQTDRVLF